MPLEPYLRGSVFWVRGRVEYNGRPVTGYYRQSSGASDAAGARDWCREEEERAKYAAARRSQIGSGDRSERIRTYNFSQNRVTDHRIGLTLYNLPQTLEGDIEPVIAALQKADYEEKLAALTGHTFAPRRQAADDED